MARMLYGEDFREALKEVFEDYAGDNATEGLFAIAKAIERLADVVDQIPVVEHDPNIDFIPHP